MRQLGYCNLPKFLKRLAAHRRKSHLQILAIRISLKYEFTPTAQNTLWRQKGQKRVAKSERGVSNLAPKAKNVCNVKTSKTYHSFVTVKVVRHARYIDILHEIY